MGNNNLFALCFICLMLYCITLDSPPFCPPPISPHAYKVKPCHFGELHFHCNKAADQKYQEIHHIEQFEVV